MKCHIPSCLGHADERTAEATCTQCQGHRWVLVKPASAPDPPSRGSLGLSQEARRPRIPAGHRGT